MTDYSSAARGRVEWERFGGYFLLHLGCLGVFWVGTSAVAIAVAIFLYIARMFFITGVYHRYFAHCSYKTSRTTQCILAFLGCMAGERGALWWSSNHRHHHRYSDQPEDIHSPIQDGFMISHAGWFMRKGIQHVRYNYIKDWTKYPELIWIEKREMMPLYLSLILLFAGGTILEQVAPQLGTNGWQLLVWGGPISFVPFYHATNSINSFAHLWGSRRFETRDHSRNNFILALVTLGEGWHNNHHWYPASASQGLKWWEIDITFYILKAMEALGIIWDLRTYPELKEDTRGLINP